MVLVHMQIKSTPGPANPKEAKETAIREALGNLTATQGQVIASLAPKGCCMQSAAVPVHLCDLLSAASCNLCDEHAWTREEQ